MKSFAELFSHLNWMFTSYTLQALCLPLHSVHCSWEAICLLDLDRYFIIHLALWLQRNLAFLLYLLSLAVERHGALRHLTLDLFNTDLCICLGLQSYMMWLSDGTFETYEGD